MNHSFKATKTDGTTSQLFSYGSTNNFIHFDTTLAIDRNDLKNVGSIIMDENTPRIRTEGRGGNSVIIYDELNQGAFAEYNEGGPIDFRNSINGNDILRMNASGGSGVEIPNGELNDYPLFHPLKSPLPPPTPTPYLWIEDHGRNTENGEGRFRFPPNFPSNKGNNGTDTAGVYKVRTPLVQAPKTNLMAR